MTIQEVEQYIKDQIAKLPPNAKVGRMNYGVAFKRETEMGEGYWSIWEWNTKVCVLGLILWGSTVNKSPDDYDHLKITAAAVVGVTVEDMTNLQDGFEGWAVYDREIKINDPWFRLGRKIAFENGLDDPCQVPPRVFRIDVLPVPIKPKPEPTEPVPQTRFYLPEID